MEQTASFLAVPPVEPKSPPVRVRIPMPGKASPSKPPRKRKGRYLFERIEVRAEEQNRLVRHVQAQKITPRSNIVQARDKVAKGRGKDHA